MKMESANNPLTSPAGTTVFRFHAMVKPGGADCNLNCTYCYYLHKNALFGQPARPRMSDEILEKHIREYIAAQTGDEVVFSWQGGEPTLLGLDFFCRVVELQRHYQKPGQRIENDLQTNGTLLNEEWAEFLGANRFLVGLSCDGPARLHDRFRVAGNGRPTHCQVVTAAKLLRDHQVPFNALCVVNRENARYPYDVYRFLTRELGAKRIQLIPCVEPRCFQETAPQHWQPETMPEAGSARARPGTSDSVVTDWSVDPDDWGNFLAKVWEDWFRRDYGKIHVDLFENAVTQAMGLPAQRCISAEFCGKALAVEHDGNVYSCDHYVYPDYRLGNLRSANWSELAFSARQIKFGLAKRDTLPGFCRRCEYLGLCWGGCPKDRFTRTPDGEPGLNYLCPGLKRFFSYIQPALAGIVNRIHSERRW